MNAPDSLCAAPGKYLTVMLASEAYGISVAKVREIVRLQRVTPMPHLPDFVKGVINLRGQVVPVLDLRLKFGLPAHLTELTCIVVVRVRVPAGNVIQVGVIVDTVEDVVNVAESDMQPTPDFGLQVNTAYLLGLARVKDQVKLLLDIDRIIAPEPGPSLVPGS